MFKKLLSSIGIGSARVDAKLAKSQYFPGEMIQGIIEIHGGSIEQQVDQIHLALMTSYIREINDKKIEQKVALNKHKIIDSFVIQPNETKSISFQFQIPYDTPVSIGKTKVWVQTELGIKMAIDPTDRDVIEIVPHPLMNAFLDAVNKLGFQIRKVQCEEARYHLRNRLPFVQEFEFKPVRGAFRGKLDELEAIFFVSENQVDCILEIDRKARGLRGLLAESLDLDETHIRFTYSEKDLPSLQHFIADTINHYC